VIRIKKTRLLGKNTTKGPISKLKKTSSGRQSPACPARQRKGCSGRKKGPKKKSTAGTRKNGRPLERVLSTSTGRGSGRPLQIPKSVPRDASKMTRLSPPKKCEHSAPSAAKKRSWGPQGVIVKASQESERAPTTIRKKAAKRVPYKRKTFPPNIKKYKKRPAPQGVWVGKVERVRELTRGGSRIPSSSNQRRETRCQILPKDKRLKTGAARKKPAEELTLSRPVRVGRGFWVRVWGFNKENQKKPSTRTKPGLI